MLADVSGEFTGVAAKGGVVILGKNVVVGNFTGETVEMGAPLLFKDAVGKFTGVVSRETKGVVVEMVSKGLSLCLLWEDPDKF